MPHKPNPGRVPAHECMWYAISFIEGEPRLWACAREWRCTKILRKAPKPELTTNTPTRGMWRYEE